MEAITQLLFEMVRFLHQMFVVCRHMFRFWRACLKAGTPICL